MCGIGVIAGDGWEHAQLDAMLDVQTHRGPDDRGTFVDRTCQIGMGANRLSIFDLSQTGHQPLSTSDGSLRVVLNGAIYNYRELRSQLADYPFVGTSDTEVLLAAYAHWGAACLDRLIGMFAFAIWDARARQLFCARDRFGIKPLYYHRDPHTGRLTLASEIKGLAAAGVSLQPDLDAWRQYLAFGLYDHSPSTFFRDISALPGGHTLTWGKGVVRIERWYSLADRTLARFPDERTPEAIGDEYLALLEDSVRLRLLSDVPVGITLSGGLDSSLLFTLVDRIQGAESALSAFTFSTGDDRYDETPWVQSMLRGTRHPWHECRLDIERVPALARTLSVAEEEPFGGLPTIAYSELFAAAGRSGTKVLLDGQGMDEQWASYDHYHTVGPDRPAPGVAALTPGYLTPQVFDARQHVPDEFPEWSGNQLLDRRLRDIMHTKIPRVLRFNDRASMLHSVELREPFLDHRLVELALALPAHQLVDGLERKALLRRLATPLLPEEVRLAPKRAVQTPQREWLSGALMPWVLATVHSSSWYGDWFRAGAIETAIGDLRDGRTDTSFAIWQMLSVALCESLASWEKRRTGA